MNLDFLAGKKILITGNTGFKGSWLTLMILKQGGRVFGMSRSVPTSPSLFELSGLKKKVHQIIVDVCDPGVTEQIDAIKPDIIFHLAAQPILSEGLQQPRYTIENNISSTLTVLEYLRGCRRKCTAIFVTSDKCYLNKEWPWSYRETDTLGGKEPYGASKAACEIVYHAYYQTYLKNLPGIRSASVRGGNVIGGGDFSSYRVIPDCIRSWQQGKAVTLRNKNGIRPWQHVLEPLAGYLQLCNSLLESNKCDGEAFNFGPSENAFHNVSDIVHELASHMTIPLPDPLFVAARKKNTGEASTLKISSEKASHFLDWKRKLDFHESIQLTATWYNTFLQKPERITEITQKQIENYLSNL